MRPTQRAWLFALAATTAAVALRAVLDRWLGNELALTTLYGAIAVSAWFGGHRPALAAAVLGYVACSLLFVDPRGTLAPASPASFVGLLLYALSAGLIVGSLHALRTARTRAGERHELLQITLASIGDAVVTSDADGRITYLNPVAEALTGWHIAEAVDRGVGEVVRMVDATTRANLPVPVTRILAEGVAQASVRNTLLTGRDGAERPIEGSAAPIRDEEGTLAGVVFVFREVTQRRRAEQALRESEERFRSLTEAITSIVWTTDPEGRFVTPQAAWSRYTGQSWEQQRDFGWVEALHPDDRDAVRELWDAACRAGTRYEASGRLWHAASGTWRHVHARGVPIRGPDGTVREWVGKYLDTEDQTRAEQALQEADRRKDEFLAMLAHELRNPLAPIRNSLEIMKHAPGDDALVRRARETIDRQVVHMQRLIDDLLDISRVTRNRLELRKQRVELAAVLQPAVESSRPAADAAHQQLNVTMPAGPVALYADPVRLTQAFGNIINNACKYTDRGGRIDIRAEVDDGALTLSVRDTGVGIPADVLPSIFDMFTQADRTLERSQGGLGIGLTLVKQLVELHDGTVEARSEGVGKGSEFLVHLPIHAEPVRTRTPAMAMPGLSGTRRRVLVVDDNRDSADSLALLLRLQGHEAEVAYDGMAGVEAVARFGPDLVLLDLGLPGLNGLDACRRMRAAPGAAQLRIVALSGWGRDDDRSRTREAGFDAHLVKPVDQDTLTRFIESLPSRS